MFLLISDTLLGDGVETLIKYQDSGRIMDSRPVLGLIEQVIVIGNKGMQEKVIARIDTGATSSSIDERLVEKLDLGPMLRLKLVKSASGSKRRPLICVKIKIDGKVMEEEFKYELQSVPTGYFVNTPSKGLPKHTSRDLLEVYCIGYLRNIAEFDSGWLNQFENAVQEFQKIRRRKPNLSNDLVQQAYARFREEENTAAAEKLHELTGIEEKLQTE